MFKLKKRFTPLAVFFIGLLSGLSATQSAYADTRAYPADGVMQTHAVRQGDYSVGARYDTSHVYMRPCDLDAFVTSFIATFGGKASPRAVFTVTPAPSKTASQYVQTPVGMLSVFGFETPTGIRNVRNEFDLG